MRAILHLQKLKAMATAVTQSTRTDKSRPNTWIVVIILLCVAGQTISAVSAKHSQKQNPASSNTVLTGPPSIDISELTNFRANKIAFFPNNDFTNMSGPALNIASEDLSNGLLIRPQMMNNFEAFNFAGDSISLITSPPEWIGDTFVRIENASATYISQINKINGELVNYRQRLVINSTSLNTRLADTFITSGPYDGSYYRLGVNSNNKISVIISDIQSTMSEIVFSNQTAVYFGDAKSHHTELTTLKILLLSSTTPQSTSASVYYMELDLQNPKQFTQPVALVQTTLDVKDVFDIRWSDVGKSFVVFSGQEQQRTYSYFEISGTKATPTTTFTGSADGFGVRTFISNTLVYSSANKGDTKVNCVEFVSGSETPKTTTYDLAVYNISTISSIKFVDVNTFAVIGTNQDTEADTNWLVVIKTGTLLQKESAIHSVTSIPNNIKSTLSIPATAYSHNDLALVGLLDGGFTTSFGDRSLQYMELWRQGPHVVFDYSGVATSEALTIFSFNVSYVADNGETKVGRYATDIKYFDPAPLSVIPKNNKVPMLDGSTYTLSDLVTVNGYTSDISLKNTTNAFLVPAWPQAKDFLNIKTVAVHSAVQGNYIFYEDQAQGLKLTTLNGQNNLISSPTKCSPQKVGTVDPENSGFAVFFAVCRDIEMNVGTQSVFVAFVDKSSGKACSTRMYLQTNSLTSVILPSLKLSSPGTLTVALVARVNHGANSGILFGRFTLTPQVTSTSVMKTQFYRQTEGWAASNLFDVLAWEDGSALSVFYAPTYSSKLSVMSFKVSPDGVYTSYGVLTKMSFGADYQYHEESRLSCVWQAGAGSTRSASCGISGNQIYSYFVKFSLDRPDSNGWTAVGIASTQNVAALNYSNIAWDGATAFICGFNTGYKATGAAFTSSRFWMQIVIPESNDNSLQAVIATNDGAFKPTFVVSPNGSKLMYPGVSLNGNITALTPQPTKIQIANAKQLSAESSTASLSFRDVAGKQPPPVSLGSVFFYKAPTPDTPTDNKLSNLIWIVIAVGGVVVVAILIAIVIYSLKKKGKSSTGITAADGNTTALLAKPGDSNLGSIMIKDSVRDSVRDSTTFKDLTLKD